MEVYPAVDVQGGRVARSAVLDPVALVHEYARDGARWIHVVDLDRALGRGENRALVRRILAEATLPVQLGGGLVTELEIAEALAWGARRVVIGSAGALDSASVARLIAQHGAEWLAVGIDARDGRVAPRGSTTVLDVPPLELARRVLGAGVRTIVYADAARDGTLAGTDVQGARDIAALSGGLEVIVSGGVASLDDLRRARDAGLAGAIVGRALHEGRFTLREALACVAA
ncbi:MAG TPA: 1-(5-phosphoribosyl)-5-[(5-phosphoribosylamino)methylideneamino] imidazole-4-carboxamide isomerase [Gemmatimonadales bacterium]|nr:1-(5-phosphoribosyl)-5-[(5-phosphoribosylamino)methylideneamino] imidazole-4-carboxamide isomerase [Gemmatimonadales bacterium]